MTGMRLRWFMVAIIIATLAVTAFLIQKQRGQEDRLSMRLDQVVRVGSETELSCAEVAAGSPLVLLALGQSNAVNHGSIDRRDTEPVTLVAEGRCITAVDPLPGGTGTGGSIWQRLPAALRARSNRPVVISILGVDATSIEEWTRENSPLRQHLAERIVSIRGLGLLPDFVLWQQGEADARDGTSTEEYSMRLNRLAAIIDEAGAKAPVILARSTICRSLPYDAVRTAIEAKAAGDHRFRLGPDTDALSGERFRRDGCHLTVDGLDSAARMWAESIGSEAFGHSLPRP